MGTNRSVRGAWLVVLGCLLTACAGAGAAEEPRPEQGPPVVLAPPPAEMVPVPEPPTRASPEEMLSLPPVTEEMHRLLDEVHTRWGAHPDLGQAEITLDRSAVVLRWYGAPPAELVALAEASGGSGFEARIEETRFRTAELVDEAGRLVRGHPGVVHSAWPLPAGDGIGVGLDPAAAGDGGPDDLARLGIGSRFPIVAEVRSPPVAAAG
ncbi:hypothetical protein [Blastococcus saxobsidens]|uniref:Lipoprotein n=1 Tax=Blastococcus saxobsidens TaxID=138336 RepID=A0A4Q7Y8Y6_9ACTN|nr:hypothetical protein [Blastococcus saxobsidens]RZU33577.1 hypothetical protein BKA19_3309 [Blastococcus saxobsidens]